MREWLSGGASPCQGEGRGFDPRLALFYCPETPILSGFCFFIVKGILNTLEYRRAKVLL